MNGDLRKTDGMDDMSVQQHIEAIKRLLAVDKEKLKLDSLKIEAALAKIKKEVMR